MTFFKTMLVFLAVLFALPFLACQPKQPEPASEIEVVFTANTLGEISPCKT